MALDLHHLRVVIDGDNDSAEKAIKQTDSSVEKFHRDASGRLRDVNGRFVATGEAAEDAMDNIKKQSAAAAQSLGQSLSKIGTSLAANVTVPLIGLGTASVKAATQMDSLMRGLVAVSGSSAAAEEQLTSLREVAKLPGLGFKEAIQGSINLQAAGFSAKQAEESLKAFGNALATVGKGKAELDGVVLALGQIQTKGVISAEEINQLAERVPQIRKAMVDAFGTANTEILQKAKISSTEFVKAVTAELGKLKPVTGGLQNDFENASDSIDQSLTRIGQAAAPMVSGFLNRLVPAIESTTRSFAGLKPETQELIIKGGLLAASTGPLAMAAAKMIEMQQAAIALLPRLVALRATLMAPVTGGLASALGIAAAGAAGLAIGATINDIYIGANDRAAAETDRVTQEMNARRGKAFQDLMDLRRRYSNFLEGIGGGAVTKTQAAIVKRYEDQISALRKTLQVSAGTVNESLGVKDTALQIDAVARAAQADAAKKAAQEAARLQKQAAEQAKQHAQNLITLNVQVRDRIFELTHDQFEVRARLAERERAQEIAAGVSVVAAEAKYAAQIKTIRADRDKFYGQIALETHKRAIQGVEQAQKQLSSQMAQSLLQLQQYSGLTTENRIALESFGKTLDLITDKRNRDLVVQAAQMAADIQQAAGWESAQKVLNATLDAGKRATDDARKELLMLQQVTPEARVAVELFGDTLLDVMEMDPANVIGTLPPAFQNVAIATAAARKQLSDFKDQQAEMFNQVKEIVPYMVRLGQSIASGSIMPLVNGLRSQASTTKINPIVAQKTDANRELMANLMDEAQRSGKQFLQTLLGGGSMNRKAAVQSLLGDLQQGLTGALTDLLTRSFKPTMEGIAKGIGDALRISTRSIEASIMRMISQTYSLLAITGAQGKKKQSGGILGAVLGGIAAIATGGAALPLITAGAALGSFAADPDLGGGLNVIAALGGAGYFGGGAGSGGSYDGYGGGYVVEGQGSGSGTFGGGGFSGASTSGDKPTRQVNVTNNIYGDINNLGGLDKMTSSMTGAVNDALKAE